jgi:hypothetical protein
MDAKASELKRKLKNARDSVQSAVSAASRAKQSFPENRDIQLVLHNLGDAEATIAAVLRELPG